MQSLGWDLYAEPASLSDKGCLCPSPQQWSVAKSHLPMQRGRLHGCRSATETVGLHDRVAIFEGHGRPKWSHQCRGASLSGGFRKNPPRTLDHLGRLESGPHRSPGLNPDTSYEGENASHRRGYLQSWGELDFGVVSRSLEVLADLSVTWAVPWKPHAALHLRTVPAMENLEASPVPEAHSRPQEPRLAGGATLPFRHNGQGLCPGGPERLANGDMGGKPGTLP